MAWASRQLLLVVGSLGGGAVGLVLGFVSCSRLFAPSGSCPSPCDGAAYNAIGGAVFIGLPIGVAIGYRAARGLNRRLTSR